MASHNNEQVAPPGLDVGGMLSVTDRTSWKKALETEKPVLIHLNADTTWLLQLPIPRDASSPNEDKWKSRTRFNILIDPWLKGPQSDVAGWFSTQWHIVRPSVETIAELDAMLRELEGGDAKSYIDVVAISHEFTDHCHQATLLELPKQTPVFATDVAADLIRSWKHFDTVIMTSGFKPRSDFRDSFSDTCLPPWLGIGRVVTEGNSLYYHSALIFVFTPPSPEADPTTERKPQAVVYSPHGIQASELSDLKSSTSGIDILALLHGMHDVKIWMTKQLNLGALNGIETASECGAKYWLPTHDEVKKGAGVIAPLLRRKVYSFKEAVRWAEKKGGTGGAEFVELGSGQGMVLE